MRDLLRPETYDMIIQRDQSPTGVILTLAERIAVKYQAAVYLTKSREPRLIAKGEILEREYAKQLQLLAEYGDTVL